MEKENETVENLFENNIQDGNVSNAFVDLPPVAPVNYEESTEEEPVQSTNEEENVANSNSFNNVEQNFVNYEGTTIDESTKNDNKDYVAKEVLENPNAKVVLNQEKDEEISSKEIKELQDIKLRDNSSLKFVLFLGIIFLIAIFIIPVISRYI